jgi:hypothetical protein
MFTARTLGIRCSFDARRGRFIPGLDQIIPHDATKQQAVESRQDAHNAVVIPLDKTLHDGVPRDRGWCFHHAKEGLERLFLVAANGRAVPLWVTSEFRE